MPVVTRRELLEAGVHFGHQTRRWNPKMHRYLYGERSGIYIIDLEKSLSGPRGDLRVRPRTSVVAAGSSCSSGRRSRPRRSSQEHATRVGMPYVNHRWLGGMLTNFTTISKRLLPPARAARDGSHRRPGLPAEEGGDPPAPRAREARAEPRRHPGPRAAPDAVFVIDTKKEHIAVTEARKLEHPRDRHRRHELRSRRGRLRDPGQRRRDPRGQPRHPRRSPTRSPRATAWRRTRPSSGSPAPLRRRPPAPRPPPRPRAWKSTRRPAPRTPRPSPRPRSSSRTRPGCRNGRSRGRGRRRRGRPCRGRSDGAGCRRDRGSRGRGGHHAGAGPSRHHPGVSHPHERHLSGTGQRAPRGAPARA